MTEHVKVNPALLDNRIMKFRLGHPDARMPSKSYQGDAGYDLHSIGHSWIEPFSSNGTYNVRTGVFLAPPDNMWLHLMPRSSAMREHGLLVIPAVIDSGYRGEMFIQVANLHPYAVELPAGTRIAQLVPHRIIPLEWEEVAELPASERGDRGFGSSGR